MHEEIPVGDDTIPYMKLPDAPPEVPVEEDTNPLIALLEEREKLDSLMATYKERLIGRTIHYGGEGAGMEVKVEDLKIDLSIDVTDPYGNHLVIPADQFFEIVKATLKD